MKAAVLYPKHQPLRVLEVDLDQQQREVLVKMAASGAGPAVNLVSPPVRTLIDEPPKSSPTAS